MKTVDNVNEMIYNDIKRLKGDDIVANVQTQVRIDELTKKQASELLEGLGLTLSDAVNMFLKQVVLQNGIPFEVKYPQYKPEVIEAMKEAKLISDDPNVKIFSSVEELFEDLDS